MQESKRRWFFKELIKLEENNVISSSTLEDIYNHYKQENTRVGNKTRLLMIFGILGGLLIGGGIILLLAHNWSSLNRIAQSALFIVPLIAAQSISLVFLVKNNVRQFWFETIGIIYYLLIGAAVAMISRIYHVGGDLESFLLVWMIGGLPVCYFLKSDSASVLYLISSVVWAATSQENGGNAVLFWAFFAAIIPGFYLSFRKSKNKYHQIFIEDLVILAITASIGVTLEKVIPGLWILIYTGYFVLLYLFGDSFKGKLRISKATGLIGISVLSILLTIRDFWDDVGFSGYRDGYRFHSGVAVLDYVLLFCILSLIVFFILKKRKSLNPLKIMVLSALIPSITGFLIPEYGAEIFQIFILLFGYSFTLGGLIWKKQGMYSYTGLLTIFFSMIIHLAAYDGFSYYWIVIYSCFLVVGFIKSGLFSGKTASGMDKLLKTICLLTGLGLIYGLSFTRYSLPSFPDGQDFSIWFIFPLLISFGSMLFHLSPHFINNKKTDVMIFLFPVFALVSLIAGLEGTLFYNLYLLVIGISVIINGLNRRSIKSVNGGIIITLCLIVTRFFDVDMSFSVRGIVFILLGASFVIFNIFFSKRLKAEEDK